MIFGQVIGKNVMFPPKEFLLPWALYPEEQAIEHKIAREIALIWRERAIVTLIPNKLSWLRRIVQWLIALL